MINIKNHTIIGKKPLLGKELELLKFVEICLLRTVEEILLFVRLKTGN